MGNRDRFRALGGAVIVVAIAMPAAAGTVITSADSVGFKSALYLEPDRVRIETQTGGVTFGADRNNPSHGQIDTRSMDTNVTIYRTDQNTVYMLTPREKKFQRITQQKMRKLAAAMAKADPHLRQAEIENARSPPAIEYRRLERASYGKWPCGRVVQLVDGRPNWEKCVASLSDLGLTEADLRAYRRYREFWLTLPRVVFYFLSQDAGGPPWDFREADKLLGYPSLPVHSTIRGAPGKTVQSIEKKAIDPALFEVPADYREQPDWLP
ncbi:MAG TPA: hypothetical protein VGR91_01435 [Stellaceae bacterium]|nr:hypothetical protein [Stellaceae bacterium]